MNALHVFRSNAFRVLRIPAGASAAEINKAAARIRQAEPGLYRTSATDVPELGDVPRSDADIRAALARLSNPVQRLTDRLLWFCQLPKPAGALQISSAMDPSGHDTALRDLIGVIATGTGLDACGLATWVKTLRAWYGVVADDDYWFLALMNEDQGGFERPVSSQDVDMVRAGAVRMAAEPLILAARAAVVANDKDTVCRVVAALTDLKDTGPWASSALEEIQCVISIVSP